MSVGGTSDSQEEIGPGSPTPAPRRSLSFQAGSVMAVRAVISALTFIVAAVLVRLLPQADYGRWRQVFVIVAVCAPTLQFGLSQSLFYFYPRRPGVRDQLLSQTLYAMGLVGALFALAMALGAQWVGAFFGDPTMADLAPRIGVFVALTMVTSPIEILPLVQQRMRLMFGLFAGVEVVRAALLLAVGLVTRDLNALVWALCAFGAFRLLVIVAVLLRQRLLIVPRSFAFLREQLTYAIPYGAAVVAATWIQRVDQLVVSRMFEPDEFAVYAVGTMVSPVIMIVVVSVTSVLLGEMAGLQKAGRPEAMAALFQNATRKLGLMVLPLVCLLACLAPDLIPAVFGRQYAGAVPIFLVFLTLVLRAATAYGTVMRAFGLTAWIFRATVLALLLAVALAVALGRWMGPLGPAIAVVLALWSAASAQLWKTGQLLGCGVPGLFRWRTLLACAILSVAVALVVRTGLSVVSAAHWVRVLIGGAAFVVLYLPAAVAVGLIQRAELGEVAGALRSLPGRS